ncbi:MAG: DUF1538 family protein, partial [Thiohalocapsa sp.]
MDGLCAIDAVIPVCATLDDVVPILAVLVGFQVLVLRRPLVQPRRILLGFVMVLLGLAFFIQGLEQALFP